MTGNNRAPGGEPPKKKDYVDFGFDPETRNFTLIPHGNLSRQWIKRIPYTKWSSTIRGYLLPEMFWWELRKACMRDFKTLPDILQEWIDVKQPRYIKDFPAELYGGTLREYQRVSAGMFARNERALCADDMGLGKTISALAGWEYLRRTSGVDTMLLVAPGAVLGQWVAEYKKFLGREDAYIIYGRKDLAKAPVRGGLICVGYHKTYRMDYQKVLLYIASKNAGRMVLCLDEAHKMGGEGTKTQSALNLLASGQRYVWALSGTEVRNMPESYLGLYRLMTKSKVPTGDFQAYYRKNNGSWDRKKLVLVQAVRRHFAIRRETEDVLDELPKMSETLIPIPWSPTQRRVHKGLVKWFPDKDTVNLPAHLLARDPDIVSLMQLDSHPGLLDDALWDADMPTPKWEALMDYVLLPSGDRQIIIWSHYPRTIEWLSKTIDREWPDWGTRCVHGSVSMSDREIIRNDFWAGKFKILIANPMAYAEGVNLQCASIAAYWDESYSKHTWEQSLKRVHRMGQERHVDVFYLRHQDGQEMDAYHRIRVKQVLASKMTGNKVRGEEIAGDIL